MSCAYMCVFIILQTFMLCVKNIFSYLRVLKLARPVRALECERGNETRE